jgi:hypothetical protein
VPLPTKDLLLALVRAEVARLDILQLGTTDVPQTAIEILRAFVATTSLFLFFSRDGIGIECLTGDLVATQQGGIILHHGDRKGQRGVAS